MYGSYARHDGSNPGTFQVLMNQDYAGLRADVGWRVNQGAWVIQPMAYAGRVDGNSRWTFQPATSFEPGSTITYFFHGYDASGGHIWDSRNGANYAWTVPARPGVSWVGNVATWPAAGQIDPQDDLWIDVETWPKDAATGGSVVFTTNRWLTAQSIALDKAGVRGNNDWWHANLGRQLGQSRVEFYVEARGADGISRFANAGGTNYLCVVNTGRPIQWVGDTRHWPTNGALSSSSELWINTETWPTGTAMRVHVLSSVQGGSWTMEDMQLSGQDGNNDAWSLNVGRLPPGHRLHYLIEARDGNGQGKRDPLTGTPLSAIVPGYGEDRDADRLADDWEQFWFTNLAQAATGNPDNDGSQGLPLENLLEEALGTDPVVSNNVSHIALVWQPSLPVQGGALRLSYNPTTHGILSTGTPAALVGANGWRQPIVSVPLSVNPVRGRHEATMLVPDAATSLDLAFHNGFGLWDNNMGLDWHIAVRSSQPGEVPDADADTLPDAWELAARLDPFSATGTDGAMGDADGDRYANVDEYRAGTDARDALSKPLRLAGYVADVPSVPSPLVITASASPTSPVDAVSAIVTGTNFVFRALSPARRWWIHGYVDANRDGRAADAEAQGWLPVAGDGFSRSSTNLQLVLAVDSDRDGLFDVSERAIVQASTNDRVRDLVDVHPWDDFDRDGINNIEEQGLSTSPLDAGSMPPSVAYVSTNTRPLHYRTIQEAVDATPSGWWILLDPGTYRGPGNNAVSVAGKSLVIRGRDGAAETVIDGEYAAPGFIARGTNTHVLVDGITIVNGRNANGGGVVCDEADVTLRRVRIDDCAATEAGGAVFVRGGRCRLEACDIVDNRSRGSGGGVLAKDGAEVLVHGTTFAGNHAVALTAGGGAVAVSNATLLLDRCLLDVNHAEGRAGAVFMVGGSTRLTHVTVRSNHAGQGGAIAAVDGVVDIANSVVWGNGPGVISESSTMTVSNSVFEYGWAGPGVVTNNPLLLRKGGRPAHESRCIDAALELPSPQGVPGVRVWDSALHDNEPGPADLGWLEYVDDDADGMADDWERSTIPGVSLGPDDDVDADGLSNGEEYLAGTDPEITDSDADWIPDGWELEHGLDPLNTRDGMLDPDRDGIPSYYEFRRGTNPQVPDPLAAPAPGPVTLSSLIQNAADGSTVTIPSGTYTGAANINLAVTGKNLLLVSAGGAATCVIDCQGQGRAITFGAGVDNRTMLKGVTIRNGNVGYALGEGGAIRITNASPIIEDCVIVSNRAEVGGGGLLMENSTGILRRVRIESNNASYNFGGGVLVRGGSPVLEQCRIVGNACRGASPHRGGGGLYVAGAKALISGSIIDANTTDGWGGGVLVQGSTETEIANCTVVENTNHGVVASAPVLVRNCIVHGNGSGNFLHLAHGVGPEFSIVGGLADESTGVVDVDPGLTPLARRLRHDSPAIDRGASVPGGRTDIDGESAWDVPNRTNQPSATDLGADEFVDADTDELADTWELKWFARMGVAGVADNDADGLSNTGESDADLNPLDPDEDNDGVTDGEEVLVLGSNPRVSDTDGDGLLDLDEARGDGSEGDTDGLQTSPTKSDTDDDGYSDREEAELGMKALLAADGEARLRMTRLVVMAHWRAHFGSGPVFHHEPGSKEDLQELAGYARTIRERMVREVSP